VSNRRGRDLSHDEATLWEGVARSVKPLRKTPLKKTDAPAAPPAKSVRKPAVQAHISARPAPPPPAAKPMAPLDRRTKQRLARGREAIDARIDLHGMTQSEAHGVLAAFLHRSHGKGCKFLLVVTGKGAQGQGVLRRQVPQWLALPEFRDMVLSVESAHIAHGGEGALYVRLRKRR
jgi:DNA-nicking Smr family endonuclease